MLKGWDLFGFGKKAKKAETAAVAVLPQNQAKSGLSVLYFEVLNECLYAANQIRDTRELFTTIGQLLKTKLSYDRFFVIQLFADGASPLISVGFEDRPFEAKFSQLEESGLLHELFYKRSTWLLKNKSDQFGKQVTDLFGVGSLALSQIGTEHLRAMVGVIKDSPDHELTDEDLQFMRFLTHHLGQIIENNEAYNRLNQQIIELKQLDQAKTTFLSIASHQLRTPLSVFRFALSFLKKPQNGSLTPKQQQIVDEMTQSNIRLINLVNNLLNITRLEQGRLQVHAESFSLAELIKSVLEEVQPKINEKQIKVSANIPDIITLNADRMLIRESMMNLITNGVKYNRPGGELNITVNNSGNDILISVADTGIGISKSDQERLFSQFFRAQQAQTIDPEGVGLGLYTTRQFIQLHGGTITMQSVPEHGTTFTISLPNKLTVPTTAQPQVAPQPPIG